MHEAMWRASRCLRMVVGVDGMFHAFLLPPTSSVRFGKSKLSPIFFGSLGPLQQLSQKWCFF